MKIRKLAYATFVGLAAVAFVIGSAVPSEAAKKKKAAPRWGPTRFVGAAVADVLGSALCTSLRDQGQPEFQLHQCLLCHERWRL